MVFFKDANRKATGGRISSFSNGIEFQDMRYGWYSPKGAVRHEPADRQMMMLFVFNLEKFNIQELPKASSKWTFTV